MDWQQFHTTLGLRYNKVEGGAETTLLYPYFHLQWGAQLSHGNKKTALRPAEPLHSHASDQI